MLVKHILTSAGLAILLGTTSLSGWAQTGAPSPAEAASNNGVIELEDGALTQYLPAYFAQYNSITARDMLRWVPGIGDLTRDTQGMGATDKRGFGSGGDQVLINGKRMSGKSNTIWDELERVQAKQVERIEVIRGAIAGLDVRSEGLIFNVVLKEGAAASGSWQVHAWTDGKGTWRTDGMISYSDTIGNVQYQASASIRPYNSANVLWRESTRSTPDGTPFEHRLDRRFDDNDEIEFVGKVSMPVKKTGSTNLNIRLAETGFESPRTVAISGIDAEGALHPLETIVTDSVRDGFEVEVGGDIEVPVGPGNLNGRFIYTRKSFDRLERNTSESLGGDAADLSLELTDQIAQELIFRGGYQWALNKEHSLDIGAEVAFNSLDKSVALDVNVDGVLESVDLPTPDSKVKEKRGEFYVTHFWTVSEKIALETVLNMEYSNIGQVGSAVDQSRSFFYAKPRLELRYAVSASDQLRVSVERTASQLDFEDFVANFDNDDDRLDAGNPNLVPEKAWVLNATYEHRLPKDAGLASLKLFYENIDDFIDRIVVTPTTDGPGNIGNAKKYGVEVTTSNRLDFIGLDNAVLDLTYVIQKTRVHDAFLGAAGPIRSKPTHHLKGTYRHDISSIGLSYWIDFEWFSRTNSNLINLRGFNKRHMGARLFIQQKLFDGVSLWANWRSINEDTYRHRDYFTTNVAAGDLSFTEQRHQWWNHEFIVGLRGVF